MNNKKDETFQKAPGSEVSQNRLMSSWDLNLNATMPNLSMNAYRSNALMQQHPGNAPAENWSPSNSQMDAQDLTPLLQFGQMRAPPYSQPQQSSSYSGATPHGHLSMPTIYYSPQQQQEKQQLQQQQQQQQQHHQTACHQLASLNHLSHMSEMTTPVDNHFLMRCMQNMQNIQNSMSRSGESGSGGYNSSVGNGGGNCNNGAVNSGPMNALPTFNMPQSYGRSQEHQSNSYDKKYVEEMYNNLEYDSLDAHVLSSSRQLNPEQLVDLTKMAFKGCEIAERLATNHQKRPCFKKIDSLCARMKQDLMRPDSVLANINSQGTAWAVKDFIFVFTRIINAWIIIKGYVYNTPEGLNKVKTAMSPNFLESFCKWQETTIDFIDNLIKSFLSLDQLVQNQRVMNPKVATAAATGAPPPPPANASTSASVAGNETQIKSKVDKDNDNFNDYFKEILNGKTSQNTNHHVNKSNTNILNVNNNTNNNNNNININNNNNLNNNSATNHNNNISNNNYNNSNSNIKNDKNCDINQSDKDKQSSPFYPNLVEDSEETQRKHYENGTYFKTGIYNPIQKDVNKVATTLLTSLSIHGSGANNNHLVNTMNISANNCNNGNKKDINSGNPNDNGGSVGGDGVGGGSSSGCSNSSPCSSSGSGMSVLSNGNIGPNMRNNNGNGNGNNNGNGGGISSDKRDLGATSKSPFTASTPKILKNPFSNSNLDAADRAKALCNNGLVNGIAGKIHSYSMMVSGGGGGNQSDKDYSNNNNNQQQPPPQPSEAMQQWERERERERDRVERERERERDQAQQHWERASESAAVDGANAIPIGGGKSNVNAIGDVSSQMYINDKGLIKLDFFNDTVIKNAYNSDVVFPDFDVINPNFIDLRSIVLKTQIGGYRNIFEIVHDLRQIVYCVKVYLQKIPNGTLESSIFKFEKELDLILADALFMQWNFSQITGEPDETLDLIINSNSTNGDTMNAN